MRSTFHWFGEREDDDIDNLWALFEAALNYADSDDAARRRDFIDKYDKVVSQGDLLEYHDGLFWIRPELSSIWTRSTAGICCCRISAAEINQKFKRVLKSLPTGEEYLQICDILQEQIASQLGRRASPNSPRKPLFWPTRPIVERDGRNSVEQEELAAPTTPPDDTVGTQLRYWVYQPGGRMQVVGSLLR